VIGQFGDALADSDARIDAAIRVLKNGIWNALAVRLQHPARTSSEISRPTRRILPMVGSTAFGGDVTMTNAPPRFAGSLSPTMQAFGLAPGQRHILGRRHFTYSAK